MDPKKKKMLLIALAVLVLSCCCSSSWTFASKKADRRFCWPGDTYGTASCPGSCQNKNGSCNGGMQITGDGRACKWRGAGDSFDCSVATPIANFDPSKVFMGSKIFRF